MPEALAGAVVDVARALDLDDHWVRENGAVVREMQVGLDDFRIRTIMEP